MLILNYSSQQYEQFMISVSNAFKELYNQISRFDSLCLRLQMIPKDTSDALSMQFTLHTIAVVAGLSSNDAQANMDKAFLCDIMRIKDISVVYSDVIEHNQNYFSNGDVPEFFSRIVELGEAVSNKTNSSIDSSINTTISLTVEWFEMLGKTYIQFYGTTPQRQKVFNDYIARMHNYLNELSIRQDVLCSQNNRPQKNSFVEESSSNAQLELESLIGLSDIKHDVDELISLAKMNKMRAENGLKSIPLSLHLVFTGNPGTGKTTVARILAKLYNEIGILSQGQLIEVDRSDLVAGYVGQTAIKTAEKIKEALGGILFIDEAYTLAKDGNDFGQEAIDTLLKAMEDNRDDFIVIVAGYQAPMEKFINSNPGLKSRFNKFFLFPDYSSDELSVIFRQICKKYDYSVSDDVLALVDQHIASVVATKTDNFANAREIRNYFERIVANQALRLSKLNDVSQTDLYTITVDDLE